MTYRLYKNLKTDAVTAFYFSLFFLEHPVGASFRAQIADSGLIFWFAIICIEWSPCKSLKESVSKHKLAEKIDQYANLLGNLPPDTHSPNPEVYLFISDWLAFEVDVFLLKFLRMFFSGVVESQFPRVSANYQVWSLISISFEFPSLEPIKVSAYCRFTVCMKCSNNNKVLPRYIRDL